MKVLLGRARRQGGGGSMHEARLCRVYAAQRAMMICQVDESDCGDLDGRY